MFFALAMFLVVLALFAMDFIHRVPAVLAGGVLLVTTGVVTEQEAIEAVYWETLGLLIGMIVVGTLRFGHLRLPSHIRALCEYAIGGCGRRPG